MCLAAKCRFWVTVYVGQSAAGYKCVMFCFTGSCLGLCAEEIHVCGEGAAIDLVTELMYTTGEEVEVSFLVL